MLEGKKIWIIHFNNWMLILISIYYISKYLNTCRFLRVEMITRKNNSFKYIFLYRELLISFIRPFLLQTTESTQFLNCWLRPFSSFSFILREESVCGGIHIRHAAFMAGDSGDSGAGAVKVE